MKQQIKPIKKYILLEILLDVLCTILSAALPVVQKLFFDQGIQSGMTRLVQIIVLYATVHVLRILFNYIGMYCTWKGAIQFEKILKDDFFSAVFRMDYKSFYKRPVAEYISMQANDITAIEQDYLQPMVDVIRSINMVIVYGSIMVLFVDARIAVVTMVVSVLATIGPQLYGKVISQKRNDYLRQQATYTTAITDLLDGFLHISRCTIDAITKVHQKVLQETAQKRMHFGKFKMLSLSINELSISVVQIVTLSMTMVLFAQGEITVGTAVAALGYVSSFLDPIESVLYDINAINSVKKVKEGYLNYIKEAKEQEVNKTVAKNLQNNICFENVCFTNGEFELKNFNYTFEKGKKYAIIGHSGSGKSTLLKLLMGHFIPSSGTVRLDNVDTQRLDTAEVISYINQSEHVFAADFAENVSVFGSYHTKQLLHFNDKLCTKAMYERLSTMDDCQQLSGGEKQVLAIIRALLKNTPVLVMDEPFSALDVANKHKVENYILCSEEMKEKTLITVTHDLSEDSLNLYDEILQMDGGRLVAYDWRMTS